MGASGWKYRVRFEGSLEATLRAVQEQVLASGEFVWPWDDLDSEDLEAERGFPRPKSIDALIAAKQVEEFWAAGTHSILDVERIWQQADSYQQAAIRPLDVDETIQVLGSATPSPSDFAQVHDSGPADPFDDLLGPKWSGRCLVLFDDESPVEVFFWGWSGD